MTPLYWMRSRRAWGRLATEIASLPPQEIHNLLHCAGIHNLANWVLMQGPSGLYLVS